MKKIFFLFTVVLSFFLFSFNGLLSQVAINNTGSLPHTSAMLDIQSTSKGILIPSMTQAQRDAISAPIATGLLIFQTNNTPGFYFYNGSAWTLLGGISGNVTGSGANGYLTFWNGTNSVTGSSKLQWQGDSLLTINGRVYQTGLGYSTFFGYGAGRNDPLTYNYNSAFGYQSLYSNIDGTQNSAFGYSSLYYNTTGFSNSAFGYFSLHSNTTGSTNSAFGNSSLNNNTTGSSNSAFGYFSLYDNTDGTQNSAFGNFSLSVNTTGDYNCAFGYVSLRNNIIGKNNSAFGNSSLYNNTTGDYNCAFGNTSLSSNTTGFFNTAIGNDAGHLIASGSGNQTSKRSVYLGASTKAYEDGDSNEIVIGYTAIGVGSNSVVLGNSSIAKTILRGTIGLGTESPNSSSIFDMTSTSKGILIPRMTQTQRDAISSPATGLLIYQTDNTPGFYYYTGAGWSLLSGGSVSGSGSNGYITFWNGTNSVTGSSNLFWNATNNWLGINTSNPQAPLQVNGRVYQDNLNFSTFFGYNAGQNQDGSGDRNVAMGYNALQNLTSGDQNAALGTDAGKNVTTGTYSVFLGSNSQPSTNNNTNEIVIGYNTTGLGSNTVVIGNSSITTTALRGSVGIGTTSPNSTSIMDLTSTSKGILIPRMTQTQRNAISSPATGLLIYQTDNTPGFYFYSGSSWTYLGGTAGSITGSGSNGYITFWNGTNSVTGSSNLFWDATNNRLGINTVPAAPLEVSGHIYQSGLNYSTFLGYQAGQNQDGSGDRNVAMGYNALQNLTSGDQNAALGTDAGKNVTTGTYSVFLGSNSQPSTNNNTNEIVIGYNTTGLGSNTVVIGNSSITTTALRGSVGIGTTSPNSTSIMDLTSTSKGILIPRMTQTQRNAISSPATGLLIYQTDNTPGFYYYTGSSWSSVSSGGTIIGSGTSGYVTFWNGTNSVTGNSNLYWDATNYRLGINTSSPQAPLQVNGRVYQDNLNFSTFFGYQAGQNQDGTGNRNIAMGYNALQNLTSGAHNTALGTDAGKNLTTASYNTAVGSGALFTTSTAYWNSAFGFSSLYDNSTGSFNSAFGCGSLNKNTSGNGNSAFGYISLSNNTTGNSNSAFGYYSLRSNITGHYNIAIGYQAGDNRLGGQNTRSIQSVYLGANTVAYQDQDTNEIVIGYNAIGFGSNTVVLGNSAITNTYLRGTVAIGNTNPTTNLDVNGNGRFRSVGSGTYSTVLNLTSDGTLTTSTSDIKMKTNIDNLNNSLDKISKLRGVSFNWKNEPDGQKHLGFIAQEMEEVIPEVVFTNPVDGYKGINYTELTAVLTEGIKEQQSQINELKNENTELKNRLSEIERKLEGKNILAKSDVFSNTGIFWVFLSVCAIGTTLFGIKKILKSK